MFARVERFRSTLYGIVHRLFRPSQYRRHVARSVGRRSVDARSCGRSTGGPTCRIPVVRAFRRQTCRRRGRLFARVRAGRKVGSRGRWCASILVDPRRSAWPGASSIEDEPADCRFVGGSGEVTPGPDSFVCCWLACRWSGLVWACCLLVSGLAVAGLSLLKVLSTSVHLDLEIF